MTIEVRDTGVGMSAEFLRDQLAIPFRQEDVSFHDLLSLAMFGLTSSRLQSFSPGAGLGELQRRCLFNGASNAYVFPGISSESRIIAH